VHGRGVLEHVDAAEVGGGVGQPPAEPGAIADIGGERGRGDALAAELVHEAVQLLLVAGDEGDVEAVGAEGPGDGEAHARAGSDDGDGGHADLLG
jgi:hypothetical protein